MSTYAEWAEANKSDVHGDGFGSDHLWHYESTPSNTSYYKCARCFWPFGHHYNSEPDIFKAMQKDGVPARCERRQMWPVRLACASKEEIENFERVRASVAKEVGAV